MCVWCVKDAGKLFRHCHYPLSLSLLLLLMKFGISLLLFIGNTILSCVKDEWGSPSSPSCLIGLPLDWPPSCTVQTQLRGSYATCGTSVAAHLCAGLACAALLPPPPANHMTDLHTLWQIIADVDTLWQRMPDVDNLWQIIADFVKLWQMMADVDSFCDKPWLNHGRLGRAVSPLPTLEQFTHVGTWCQIYTNHDEAQQSWHSLTNCVGSKSPPPTYQHCPMFRLRLLWTPTRGRKYHTARRESREAWGYSPKTCCIEPVQSETGFTCEVCFSILKTQYT